MAKSTRRTRGAVKPDLADEFPLEDTKPSPPKEPAEVIAGILIGQAMTQAQVDASEIARDGVVVLIRLPTPAWREPTIAYWQTEMRGTERPAEGFSRSRWPSKEWAVWAPEYLEGDRSIAEASENFAATVAAGRHCLAMSADVSWLPRDVVDGADCRLEMAKPTAADVAAMAKVIFGEVPSVSLSDSHSELLTPRLLRLARRPDQDAHAYVIKLSRLLERERVLKAKKAPTKGETPREEPTLERLHGMDEAVAWGMRLRTDMTAYKEGFLPWADVDRGCLLSGDPGCGKTLFARALAASCGVPLVSSCYSEWHASGDSHQGSLLKAMRKTFTDAREKAPCILFIDEIDSFPDRASIRHHYASWERQVVNGLLALIDGTSDRDGVVLLGACNHPETLDPALTRSGRLDRHIKVTLPDPPALALIFREHLADDLADVELSGVALLAAGSSGADCERLVRNARRTARNAERPMELADLIDAVNGGQYGSQADLRRAAIHEAGHAVAYCVLLPGSLRAVTLKGAGQSAGGTMSAVTGQFLLANNFHLRLMAMLAGRAAEEIVFGYPSTGSGGPANSDLALATTLATSVITSYGFGDDRGLVWTPAPTQGDLQETLMVDRTLADSVRADLNEAYLDVLKFVRGHRKAVEGVAEALMAKGALDGVEAAEIVARHPGAAL